jgi:predicted ribosome quality control (RQC) complex YloA/Tae2 family protein
MKSQLSSFELRHLLQEFQHLVGAKIEKVFQQPKPRDEFLFVLHVPSKGKQFLYISLPDVLCISSFKPTFPTIPPHFASSLRRKITNARIQSIVQKDLERIVIIELSTKQGTSFLIIELFTPGNIILCDDSYKILSVLHPKQWQDRSVLPGKQYEFPSAQVNPYDLTIDTFKEIIKNTDRDSLVKAIATECSLGGEYSEELLLLAKMDKNKNPKDLSDSEIMTVFSSLTFLLNAPVDACKSKDCIYPIRLQGKKDLVAIDSFNYAIQELILSKLETREETSFTKHVTKTKSKFERIIQAQKKQLRSLEKSEKENQIKGELIYSHYQSLKTLMDKITELRNKGQSWDEIKEIIKQVPQVKNLDESKGILELDLEASR